MEIKSDFASKINWVQVASPLAAWLATKGLDISAENLVAIILGIQALQSVVTVVLRTWFTTKMTTSSVKPSA